MKKLVWKTTNYGVGIYPLVMIGEMLYYNFHKLAGENFAKGMGDFSNHTNRWAVVPGDLEKVARLIISKISRDKKWVELVIKKTYQTCDDLLNLTDKIFKADLSRKTPKQLLSFYQQYNKNFKTMYLYGWLPNAAEGFDNLFSEKLEKIILGKLKKLGKAERIGEYFSILTALPKDSWRDKEQKEFLGLLKKAKGVKNLEKLFSSHHAKYLWLQYDYDGPALPLSYFVSQAKDLLNNKINPTKELQKLLKQKSLLLKAQKQAQKELKLTAQEKYLFWLAREFSFIKNYRKDVLYKSYFQINKLLREIGLRLNLSVRQVKHILPQEMPEVLIKKKYRPNLLNQRIKYCALIYGPKQPKILVGNQAKKIIKERVVEPKIKSGIKALKGQVAYSGQVVGKVKIVNSVEEMKGFEKGNILVSEKTNPNLIPALKIAAAIVTDAGGLTCHAAIVSRELKKPCIVGTEIATKVFKNGDMVEVDANAGTVRILEKGEKEFKSNSPHLLQEVSKTDWRSNWAGAWSLLECCSYGYEYTTILEKTWGKGLELVLFRFEKGRSINLIPAATIHSFLKHLAGKLNNKKQLEVYVNKLGLLIKEILKVLNRPQIRNYQEYQQIWEVQDRFLAYNFPTKQLPEYLSPKLAKEFLPIIQKLRLQGEPIYDQSQKLIQEFTTRIGKRAKLPGHLVSCLTLTELEQFLASGFLPDRKELEARYRLSVLVVRGRERQVFTGTKAQLLIKNITKAKIGDKLLGQSAYPGLVRGVVKVVKDPSKAKSIPKAMILVTSMTRPEYLYLFKKALAVITDAGGILSHAAITARELKKPTIIGTEVATQVLKDGDLVEVDANHGLVKILTDNRQTFSQPLKAETKTGVMINGIEWNLFVTRNMSFWHHVISSYGHYHYARDWGMKVPLQYLHLTVHGTQTHVFKNSENARAFDTDVLETFSTEERIKKIKQFYETFSNQLLRALNRCLDKLSLENWETFSEAYARFAHGLGITATMGRIGMERLMKKLQELGLTEQEIPSTISAITYPKHHTPLFTSTIDLLDIGERIQSGKLEKNGIKTELGEWLKKHGYIPVNFVDEPWSLSDAEKQLENLLQKNCRVELETLNKSHLERVRAAQRLLKKINNHEVSLLAHALQEATNLNEFRKNIFSKISWEMRPLFAEIAKMASLSSWRDCYYLTPDEILNILKNEIKSTREIVKKRDIVGMYTNKNGKQIFLTEKEMGKIYRFIQSLHKKANTVGEGKLLKGFSASPGYAKGVAKVVLSSKDFHKLHAGEILITTMTSVDFVPVMERAAAFVTNEGGITSHAAIVAREMNKPCIIGTRIATKVLKDGDLVEVDAFRGIVKKIK